MELTVTQRRENPLLDRTEVHFTAAHPNEATPSRVEIRKALAAALDAKDAIVVLDWARSEYGRTVTQGYAKVYPSKERAIELETTPILIRNGLVAAVAKPAAPKEKKPAPPPKKKEAPKEEKPPKAKEPPKEPPKKEEKKAEKKEAPEKEPPKAKKAAKEEAPAKEEKPAKAKEAPKEKKAAKKGGK